MILPIIFSAVGFNFDGWSGAACGVLVYAMLEVIVGLFSDAWSGK
jgi:hypothetical protein